MSSDITKKSYWLLSDKVSCATAIKHGGIMAISLHVLPVVFGISKLFRNTSLYYVSDSFVFFYISELWVFLNSVLIIILGILILRKSRIAATLMVINFISIKVITWGRIPELANLGFSIVFLLVYTNAMRGTYLWHSKYRNAPS